MALNPLDPSTAGRINKQYEAFYNKNIAHKPMVHQVPWTPKLRDTPAIAGGADVNATFDSITVVQLPHCTAQLQRPIFWSRSEDGKAPVFLWIHGGGMVLGSTEEEQAFCSRVSLVAGCVILLVEYRLAPEHTYPAGHDDAWDAFKWIIDNAEEQRFDLTKIGVGGLSSGANLALCVAQRAGIEGIPIDHVIASVPVCDNTANAEKYESWDKNRNSPGLPVAKMEWYRDQYLPNHADRADWRSSPLLAPDEVFAGGTSHYLISLVELDLLQSEGQAYADRLTGLGKDVSVQTWPGVPHAAQAMDGVLDISRGLVTHVCDYIRERLGDDDHYNGMSVAGIYRQPLRSA